ncbi:MAG TPA: 2-oxo acid dehydrogenase subunit E2, partial [Chloroflexota bacterium]
VVPVVRGADQKNVTGLAHSLADVVGRARAGKLTVADVEGGTFTVNNTGAFGSIASQPIINYPQAAILNLEAIVKRPIVVDDAIAIRSMLNLCLSFDHRILDGATAGRFLQSVKRRLESWGPGSSL